jgi:hypothetical protein
VSDTPNSNQAGQSSGGSGGGGGQRRRRRHRSGGGGGGGHRPEGNRGDNQQRGQGNSAENRNRNFQSGSRSRSRHGRALTTNQVLVKYDNLLEQHLITRRKYYEYFNRVDDRQLQKLERNFFASIEHLRAFEAKLEHWQREALEKRKTERYKLDLTYSKNRDWNPEEIAKEGFAPDENEDPHFKDTQREAFDAYKEDTEESMGSYEDYLKYKGQA